ncbi:MAG: hypothetical protein AB1489_16470 [Acidobacteriota bacterium]
MSLVMVQESSSKLELISVPARVSTDEGKLRNYLDSLARNYSNSRLLCFWMGQSGGGLKAFFWTVSGLESRTYSTYEVTEALFHKKPLFSHCVTDVIALLEEPAILAA